MKVEITVRFTWETYIAATKAECKGEVDKKVWPIVK